MKTILEVLNGATDYLEKRGIESARLNAEHLLAHVLKKKRLELYLEFDRPLGENHLTPMRDLLKERGVGKPLQHLLGTAEFLGREFLCDARALVPRPETEQLLEQILEKEKNGTLHFLDVGTGSGIIAITLALEFPDATVSAVDLSTDALDLAKANAAKHQVEHRLQFFSGNLIPDANVVYQCIVANLPYIPTADIATLAQEVRHDPSSALDGGETGMEIILNLIQKCPAHLAPGGRLYLEIGHGQGKSLSDALEQKKFRDIKLANDYQGYERFLSATYG